MIKYSTVNRYDHLMVEKCTFVLNNSTASDKADNFSSYEFVIIGAKTNTYHGIVKKATGLSGKGILVDICGGSFIGK